MTTTYAPGDDCPTCNGTGMVDNGRTDMFSGIEVQDKCRDCDGTGLAHQ